MGTQTPRFGATLFAGTDNVTREAFNANTQVFEDKAALRDEVNQPFYLKSVTHDSANNRLVLTVGPGRAAFLNTLISKTGDTTYYINAPATNTTYYLFIKSDGTFTHSTIAAEAAGAVCLWQIATGAAVSTITTTDRRGQLPGAPARAVQDGFDTHKSAATLDHPDGSVTDAKIGNRTADQSQAPAAPTGTVSQLFSWLANRIKSIMGTTNWWDSPATTLASAKSHMDAVNNPHGTTAAQVGALVSVDGVSNAGGNIDLVSGGAITITPNDASNTITISETHSTSTNNPHSTTAAQVGALVSVEGVSNPGGNIDLVGVGITVTGDDAANTITLTATATSIGALVSIDGVSNAGGNVDLVAGGAITITPNDVANTITISESHSSRTDNPHGVTAAQVGAIPTSEKGTANGVATLGADQKVPTGQLPAMNYVDKGDSNQSVAEVLALLQPIDTRSVEITPDAQGRPATVTVKDGVTVVASTTLTYDSSSGRLTSTVKQIGGKTITNTLTYDANGNVTGRQRSVV